MPACPSDPAPRRRPRCRRFGILVALLGVLVVAGGPWADAALADGTEKPETKFGSFETAWKAGSADDLTACMETDGTVTFTLLAYPLSGKSRSMKPEQAKATLKAYFKRVSSIQLEDVSPKKSPKNIRLYEYTYKPAGENARTTHLRVQLKQDKNRLWVLASVTESAKPRK